MALTTINPATGDTLKEYPEMAAGEAAKILAEARTRFLAWRRTPWEERSALLRAVARELRSHVEPYARLMAQEMGKPVTQGRPEVEKCAWVCEHYAQEAPRYLAPETIPTDASKTFVAFEPLGVVLAVMPWNFPFWQVFRFGAPALMAGNTVVLKHASSVTGCALAIEETFRRAGAPEGLLRAVLVGSGQVAELIRHPAVAAVTLTGSTPAGQAVASAAGASLKKVVLELGGSDPYVVLEDADLDNAVETCVAARLVNAGQSCVAAKRFIVVRGVLPEFQRRMVERMAAKRIGNPLQEDVDVGPLARHDLRDGLHGQVRDSVARGARVLLGGQVPEGQGAFYPPTVLAGVAKGMPAYDEELFGPVAALIEVADEAQAVRVANDTMFGLGSAVFTRDLGRGERLARFEIEAGCCFVNTSVRSDPRVPFGGIKASGYGRELGLFGIREFVNVKTIWIK